MGMHAGYDPVRHVVVTDLPADLLLAGNMVDVAPDMFPANAEPVYLEVASVQPLDSGKVLVYLVDGPPVAYDPGHVVRVIADYLTPAQLAYAPAEAAA